MTHRPRRFGAFTLTEILVVLAMIAILLALLLPALAGVRSSGLMAKSMSNLNQIGRWVRLYAGENRESIVPSQFDYSNDSYPGKVRQTVSIGPVHQGTWADILWTAFEPGVFPDGLGPLSNDYRYDSPDIRLYDLLEDDIQNPLRAAAKNTRNFGPDATSLPTPFGEGAYESGRPGYFAANQFFDATGGDWYVTGQIRQPERSMYLVDSVAGEVIEDDVIPYDLADPTTHEVDFRYVGSVCLMLFLDGHVDPIGRFQNLAELNERQIRVRNLDSRLEVPPP